MLSLMVNLALLVSPAQIFKTLYQQNNINTGEFKKTWSDMFGDEEESGLNGSRAIELATL